MHNLHELELGTCFLDIILKAQATATIKIGEFGLN